MVSCIAVFIYLDIYIYIYLHLRELVGEKTMATGGGFVWCAVFVYLLDFAHLGTRSPPSNHG